MAEKDTKKDEKDQKKTSGLGKWAVYSEMAFQMLIIIGLGAWGGVKLDEAYPNEFSIFTIICSLLAIAIALYFVIKQVSSQQE